MKRIGSLVVLAGLPMLSLAAETAQLTATVAVVGACGAIALNASSLLGFALHFPV